MEFFPESFLKNRYLNKGYRLLVVLYRKWLALYVNKTTFNLEKLGSNYGGWFVPAATIKGNWIIYSGGIGSDTTFEEALIRRYGCMIFAFDPTPGAIDHVTKKKREDPNMQKFVFRPVGLWSENTTLKFYSPKTRGWTGSYSARNLHRRGRV